ncbi:hypothetical protein Goklo_012260, partial [Gossypium klotzschianum]|nr:hypothetical protein [Gossypium klotzschianum]
MNNAYYPNTEEVVYNYNGHFFRTILEFNSTKENMKRLADCATGFAHGTTGGNDCEFYVVTNPSKDAANPKPRTLRHATIDVRGANVKICNGADITVQFVKNVIIHGLHIHHINLAKGGKVKDGENHLGLRTATDRDR